MAAEFLFQQIVNAAASCRESGEIIIRPVDKAPDVVAHIFPCSSPAGCSGFSADCASIIILFKNIFFHCVILILL
jgi:hypothetical protein